MAVTNSGMTLYSDNDDDTGWLGTDNASIEVFWQGIASQSWIVSKTATETGTLTISADMSAAKYFTFAMLSTIAPFYNTITMQMESSANNYEEFLLADRTIDTITYRAIAGEFKYSAVSVEFGQGTTTGTYARGSLTLFRVTVDNSTSGNIRSVENHYLDAMYYGNGRTISGTTVGDKLFTESDDLNISGDVLDCCTLNFHNKIFAQTDIYIDTTTGNSYGETLVFVYAANTSNLYLLTITGVADFQGTNIEAEAGATVAIDTTASTTFDMLGGNVVNGSTSDFKTGDTVTYVVFTGCGEIDTNGATMSGCTINETTVTGTVGAVYIADTTELGAMSYLTFNNYTGKYAIHIPATVTGTITLTGFVGDGSGTDVYWAASSGTLVINKAGGTNFSTWSAEGTATVDIVASININIHVQDQSAADVAGAFVYVDEDHAEPYIINTSSDINGDVSGSYSGAATECTIRIRKYGFKPYVGTASLTSDINLNVTLITDPQQT